MNAEERERKQAKSRTLKFDNNDVVKNGLLKVNSLNEKNKLNEKQSKQLSKFAPNNEKKKKGKLRSSQTLIEVELIEKKLLESIRNSEKIDNDKIQLAESIGFKENPDKIIDTDEFGFFKDSKDTKKEEKDALLNNARVEKWNYMLSDYEDFYKNHFSKLKQRVRKGIPDSLRGYAWQKIINVDEFYQKDLYEKISEEEFDKNVEQVIIKDIDRTFPQCSFFKEKYGGGQRQLYKVLVNYSKYNKSVGYVQGMGFIAALLLTYMDEERTFFMMHTLMKKRDLETLYLPGFPGLNKKLFVLLNLEKKYLPKVYNVLKKFDVIPFSYASEWFLCLFSRNLKFNSLVRIFDTFILEGYKVIYRFSLAFLKLKEQKIIECTKMEKIFKILKDCFENLDIEELFKIAFNYNFRRKEITNYEKEYDKIKEDKTNEFIAQL